MHHRQHERRIDAGADIVCHDSDPSGQPLKARERRRFQDVEQTEEHKSQNIGSKVACRKKQCKLQSHDLVPHDLVRIVPAQFAREPATQRKADGKQDKDHGRMGRGGEPGKQPCDRYPNERAKGARSARETSRTETGRECAPYRPPQPGHGGVSARQSGHNHFVPERKRNRPRQPDAGQGRAQSHRFRQTRN